MQRNLLQHWTGFLAPAPLILLISAAPRKLPYAAHSILRASQYNASGLTVPQSTPLADIEARPWTGRSTRYAIRPIALSGIKVLFSIRYRYGPSYGTRLGVLVRR